MIGYTSLGTNSLTASSQFYDTLLGRFGAKRVYEASDFIVWGQKDSSPMFSIHVPFNGNQATVGNGVMIAFRAENRKMVDEIHSLAITLGGQDEGPPGDRAEGFYAAYFRDLDGNKLNIHHMG